MAASKKGSSASSKKGTAHKGSAENARSHTFFGGKRERYNFSRVPEALSMPSLIDLQKTSYEEFLQKDVAPQKRKNKGLQASLMSLFPVQDFSGRAQLEFETYRLEDPKHDIEEARYKGLTYSSPLRANLRLVLWGGEGEARTIRMVREQEVYLGDIPLMTENGTFIINGVERVVVSQMHRSPGVFFDHDHGGHSSGKLLYLARVIPSHGSWLDFEFDARDLLYVRIDRKRKILVTTFLRTLLRDDPHDGGSEKDDGMSREEILATFYKTVICVHKNGAWAMPFLEDAWRGVKLEEDLIDADTGEVLIESGTKVSKSMIAKVRGDGTRMLRTDVSKVCGRFFSIDMVHPETGEVFAEAGEEIKQSVLERLLEVGITEIPTLDIDYVNTGPYLRNTLMADKNMTRTDALYEIYRVLRPGETPTQDGAETLYRNLFFNPERYDLSDVGRVKMNTCLGLDTDPEIRVLQRRDVIAIVRFLLNLRDGRGAIDDIDSLSNRRVRSVGELLEGQYRAGLVRVQRSISERMSSIDLEEAMPNDLMNVRPLSSVIREFFGTSQLSQFMDQTNPLSEVNHKRRISALGPGGLQRGRAGLEVRDVHPTHYGRICPVETPEGQNIGLINSLAIYARVNKYGFLETPYRRVVDGRLTNEIVYVSAMEEERYIIAQADVETDANGNITDQLVGCRHAGNYLLVSPQEIHFADVSPKQILSVAAALIPFIENDDVTRALMGSNMQRQAVPLMRAEAPLVGTGMEGIVARDSGVVTVARRSGVVDQVEAKRIVVRATESLDQGASVVDIYNLAKFQKSNSGTCVHQQPLVYMGQRISAGDVIADGGGTDSGELALGRNVLVAFMSWRGYCFEDSIVLSERLIRDDVFTSIHIEEFEVSARDTRLGYEEITRDIPGANDEAIRHLDEAGIAYIGAEVRPGDVLVGKVSPKAEVPLTPEEKLLRAVFADKAADVKDTSLRVPPGVYGTVVDVRIFSRRGIDKDERALSIVRDQIAQLIKDRDVEQRILEQGFERALKELLVGKVPVKNPLTGDKGVLTEEDWAGMTRHQKTSPDILDESMRAQVDAMQIQHKGALQELHARFNQKVEKIHRGDDLPTGILKTVKMFIAVKRKVQPGDKMAGRHGNKGVVSVIVPVEDMPHFADGTPVDIVLNPLGLPSRMNVGQIMETHLGWASVNLGKQVRQLLEDVARKNMSEKEGTETLKKNLKVLYAKKDVEKKIDNMSAEELISFAEEASHGLPMACPVFEGARVEDIRDMLTRAGRDPSGQEVLYDGRTGEAFDRPVTVGIIYMLKLHHLVDEKIHARSVGPYSLVTQQPLGGKAQFGGQRLGEMEVWALEAYGAAHILQEMLTIKSDDVAGRTKVYEAIIKGQETFDSGVPESFKVLVKELRTLGLNMECVRDTLVEDETLVKEGA